MKLAKVRLSDGTIHIAKVDQDQFYLLEMTEVESVSTLSDILHSPDPKGLVNFLQQPDREPLTGADIKLLAPIDNQEVWAAGVTYKRSQVARMEESEAALRITIWSIRLPARSCFSNQPHRESVVPEIPFVFDTTAIGRSPNRN